MMAGLAERAAGEPAPAPARAGRRAGGVPRGRPRGLCAGGRVPRLPGGLRQAADPHHRGRDDARPSRRRSACWWRGRRNGRRSDERDHPVRAVRRGAGRPRPLRPDRPSRAAAQDPRLQSPRQRRLPAVRRDRAPGRGGRAGRRSGAAGAGHHRHRRRLRGARRSRSRCCCGCSRRPAGPRWAPTPRRGAATMAAES